MSSEHSLLIWTYCEAWNVDNIKRNSICLILLPAWTFSSWTFLRSLSCSWNPSVGWPWVWPLSALQTNWNCWPRLENLLHEKTILGTFDCCRQYCYCWKDHDIIPSIFSLRMLLTELLLPPLLGWLHLSTLSQPCQLRCLILLRSLPVAAGVTWLDCYIQIAMLLQFGLVWQYLPYSFDALNNLLTSDRRTNYQTIYSMMKCTVPTKKQLIINCFKY